MRKKNGFVFVETIVVVSVLSITLLILFASYSYILRRSRERNTYDTTEMIYKTYHVKNIIDSMNTDTTLKGVVAYARNNTSVCKQMSPYDSIVCDLSANDYSGNLYQVKTAFEVEKFYLVNTDKVLKDANSHDWLLKFDATTIDYINSMGAGKDYLILIVKYKKTYGKPSGSYEIFHASVEV